jgi:predicted O-methyltransferase YrrM
MSDTLWTHVDSYFNAALLPSPDDALLQATVHGEQAGLPPHHIAPNQAALLTLLMQMIGARRVLEVGTLAGYSTIWLARALPPDGSLISLELEPSAVQIARENLRTAGVADRVKVREGAARDSLQTMIDDETEPFDFIFIDADKQNNPAYFTAGLALSHPGTVIVIDNVVRGGAVIDADSDDPRVQGVRAVLDLIAAEPRVRATALQTVGEKGYDGLILAVVQLD